MPYQSSRAVAQMTNIIAELSAAGIIPKQCTRFELVAEPCKAITIKTEAWATQDDIDRIAEALMNNPEEVAAMTKEVILKDPRLGQPLKVVY